VASILRATEGTVRRHPAAAVRVSLLALVGVLGVAFGTWPGLAVSLVLVLLAVLAAVVEHAAADRPWITLVLAAVETLVCVAALGDLGTAVSPLFPYLLAPAFAAGSAGGAGAALAVAVAMGAVLAATGLGAGPTPTGWGFACVAWVTTALLAGQIAAGVRTLRLAAGGPSSPYAEAYRLLSQLYSVTRHLPGSLDPVVIADRMLDALAVVVNAERAAVLVQAGGDLLVPLAYRGSGDRLDWDTSLRADNLISEAWATQHPMVGLLTLPGAVASSESGSALVVPIRMGVRTLGVVALDTHSPAAFPATVIEQVERVVHETALRLAAGLLFDEVRAVATAEERRRLAREIHDGIAQELASLGYVVDALTAQAHDEHAEEVAEELTNLRQQITRLVSEVRLSIFDLRSDVDRHGGLGAALSEYVRTIGASSDLTVHLTLDEEPRRLPAESEAELLRIAQEAINNARKHAGASNLWVTCRVDPPRAQIVVEDDGKGLGSGRADSFGLEIMRERAERLRGTLQVRRRDTRGTRVEVVVGTPLPGLGAESTTKGGGDPVGVAATGDSGGLRANDSAAR
jgi:signal transduction histidine kinase